MQLSQPTLEPHSLCYTCCVQVVLYYTGKVFGALRPYLLPYRDERQMNLSYMVLSRHVENVWAKIPQFHRRLVGWAGATESPAHNKSMRT